MKFFQKISGIQLITAITYLCPPLLLILPLQLAAIEITIDPGAVNDQFTSKSLRFNDLNGTIPRRQNLQLDFIFDAKKNLEPIFLNSGFDYNVTLTFRTINFEFSVFPLTVDGFLSDENGLSIAEPEGFGQIQLPGNFGYELDFPDNEVNGLVHHDIHFNVSFPNIPSARIIEGTLTLKITDPTGFIRVGEGTIPVPSARALPPILDLLLHE